MAPPTTRRSRPSSRSVSSATSLSRSSARSASLRRSRRFVSRLLPFFTRPSTAGCPEYALTLGGGSSPRTLLGRQLRPALDLLRGAVRRDKVFDGSPSIPKGLLPILGSGAPRHSRRVPVRVAQRFDTVDLALSTPYEDSRARAPSRAPVLKCLGAPSRSAPASRRLFTPALFFGGCSRASSRRMNLIIPGTACPPAPSALAAWLRTAVTEPRADSAPSSSSRADRSTTDPPLMLRPLGVRLVARA